MRPVGTEIDDAVAIDHAIGGLAVLRLKACEFHGALVGWVVELTGEVFKATPYFETMPP